MHATHIDLRHTDNIQRRYIELITDIGIPAMLEPEIFVIIREYYVISVFKIIDVIV
jgi:hypothetical protein